jgi:hypothetical protein
MSLSHTWQKRAEEQAPFLLWYGLAKGEDYLVTPDMLLKTLILHFASYYIYT